MKRHFLNEEKLNKQHQLEENRRSTNNRSPVITQTCSIDLSPKNNNQVNNKPTTALESRKVRNLNDASTVEVMQETARILYTKEFPEEKMNDILA